MKIVSNLAMSLDGKIIYPNQVTQPLGSPYDRKLMQKIREHADAVLIGAETFRVHPVVMKASKLKKPYNVILTESGNLPEAKFWDDPSVIRFVFTTKKSYFKVLRIVKDRAFVYHTENKIDLNSVVKILKNVGVKNLLVEGGAVTLRKFLDLNLLHEINVTLTPQLIGGMKTTSLVGGEFPLKHLKKLRLNQVRKVKNELYLNYKIIGANNV